MRSLTLNNLERFEDEILLQESLTNLQYAVVGYNTSIYGTELGDTGGGHSPIIGWAYDGNQFIVHMVLVILKIQTHL